LAATDVEGLVRSVLQGLPPSAAALDVAARVWNTDRYLTWWDDIRHGIKRLHDQGEVVVTRNGQPLGAGVRVVNETDLVRLKR
jgi:hypothetical protein